MSTKIHLAVDGRGRPVRFLLTPGQAHDASQALALLDGFAPRHVIADRAYDSHAIVDALEALSAKPVIPQRRGSKRLREFDPVLYRKRNLIERTVNRLKQFRRLATRYDRNPAHLLAFLHLAALCFWIS